MTNSPTVFIVDDDVPYLDSIAVLIKSMGWQVKTFPSAESYLRTFDPELPGCLILDVRMPVTGGLVLQESLNKFPLCPAIVIMTGHAEVPTVLRAMRQGAVDFLQKTFTESELYETIQRAITKDAMARKQFQHKKDLAEQFAQLSQGEHDVLQLILQGESNKRIASQLDLSQRAVEDRRARIMQKLDTKSVADLIRLSIEAGLWKDGQSN